jgi:hypothetical protein
MHLTKADDASATKRAEFPVAFLDTPGFFGEHWLGAMGDRFA